MEEKIAYSFALKKNKEDIKTYKSLHKEGFTEVSFGIGQFIELPGLIEGNRVAMRIGSFTVVYHPNDRRFAVQYGELWEGRNLRKSYPKKAYYSQRSLDALIKEWTIDVITEKMPLEEYILKLEKSK